MNEQLESYITKLTNRLACSKEEKNDLVDEIRDHLYTTYENHLVNGVSEKEAAASAIKSFGETFALQTSFQEMVDPLYGWLRKISIAGFIVYCAAIIWLVLVKRLIERIIMFTRGESNIFVFTTHSDAPPFFDFSGWEYNMNLVPFKTIWFYFSNDLAHMNLDIILNNLLGNAIMLVPLGLLLPFLSKYFQSVTSIVTISFVSIFSIEILQFSLQIGRADIDDIILNTLGAVVGYGGYKLIKWFLSIRLKFSRRKDLYV